MMKFLIDDYLPRREVTWVLVAGNWQLSDAAEVEETLDWLKQEGFRVILAGPVVRYQAPLPQVLAIASQRHDSNIVSRSQQVGTGEIDKRFEAIARDHGALYFSPYRTFCPEVKCESIDSYGFPLQFDAAHLTAAGSALAVRNFPIREIDAYEEMRRVKSSSTSAINENR